MTCVMVLTKVFHMARLASRFPGSKDPAPLAAFDDCKMIMFIEAVAIPNDVNRDAFGLTTPKTSVKNVIMY